MKARRKKRYDKTKQVIVSCAIILIFSVILWAQDGIPRAQIQNGQIQRTYADLLDYLEEAPEDITAQPYEPHISEIVQKDIQRMLNSKKELMIVYESADKSSQIKIKRSNRDEEKIQVAFFGITDYMDEFAWDEALIDEISFYKKGNHIVVYGRSGMFPRELITTEISLAEKVSKSYCNLDLCGTEYFDNYDDIWDWNKEMTLIRVGNEFKFFKSGFQQGLSVIFIGKIIETSDIFPYIYQKEGKRYAGIKTSRLFDSGNEEPIEMLNFDVDVIELSESNIKWVEIEYNDFTMEWWAKIIYDDSPCLVYELEMISNISHIPHIPDEEIDLFNGITVSPDEFKETVDEIKKTCKKYEKK